MSRKEGDQESEQIAHQVKSLIFLVEKPHWLCYFPDQINRENGIYGQKQKDKNWHLLRHSGGSINYAV